MTNPITFAYQAIATGFCYLEECLQSSNTDIMIEMPPFGANQWKEHFGVDVEYSRDSSTYSTCIRGILP